MDLKHAEPTDPDSMHSVVLDAFRKSYGIVDETNIDHILTQLDHQSLMRQMKIGKN